MKSEFEKTLDIFLARKKWRQRDLSHACGVGEEHISRIIKGRIRPSADVCHKFCKVLELGPADYQYLHQVAARAHGFAV